MRTYNADYEYRGTSVGIYKTATKTRGSFGTHANCATHLYSAMRVTRSIILNTIKQMVTFK
jgi:hypothetical protein